MKKIVSIVLISILIPQVALAAWWNPFSWFSNWTFTRKTDTQTQVLEQRIQELEKKLGDTTTTSTTTSTSTTSSTIKGNSSVPSNSKPSETKISQPIKKVEQTVTNVIAVPNSNLVTYAEVVKKYTDFQLQITNERNGLNKNSSLGTERQYFVYINELLNSITADHSYLMSIKYWNPRPAIEEIYMSKFNKLKNEYDVKSKQYSIDERQDALNSSRQLVINYIQDNKYQLYEGSVHVKAAAMLSLFDRLFKTKYGQDFESKKTQIETVEFANRFLIEQGESILKSF